MTAGITAAGASQSGDLMHDLKAGYMLKVSIRKQVWAQLIGVIAGVFAAAAVYRLLTAAYEVPGEDLPGPAVLTWYTMAKVLGEGIRVTSTNCRELCGRRQLEGLLESSSRF